MLLAVSWAQGLYAAWVECIWSAEKGFRSPPDHKRSRPPSSTVVDAHLTILAGARNGSAMWAGIWDVQAFDRLTWAFSLGELKPETQSGDDCTPHIERKDTKSPWSPCLSPANNTIYFGLVICSCGLTSIFAIPVLSATAHENLQTGQLAPFYSNSAAFIFFFVTENVLKYKKQKTGIWEKSYIVQP